MSKIPQELYVVSGHPQSDSSKALILRRRGPRAIVWGFGESDLRYPQDLESSIEHDQSLSVFAEMPA